MTRQVGCFGYENGFKRRTGKVDRSPAPALAVCCDPPKLKLKLAILLGATRFEKYVGQAIALTIFYETVTQFFHAELHCDFIWIPRIGIARFMLHLIDHRAIGMERGVLHNRIDVSDECVTNLFTIA